MARIYSWLKAREEGVTVIEYGVTVALVSLVLGLALQALGQDIFGGVADAAEAAMGVTFG